MARSKRPASTETPQDDAKTALPAKGALLYVVALMRAWDALELEGANVLLPGGYARITRSADDHNVGFMPVFDDLDAAIEYAGGRRSLIKGMMVV